ncbi:hypothetical protein CVT25_011989 [Psilocybe cyanescens]|uniref:Uncharacterized protein n=1 Tax=Psilocybe cyanescens TaxID=93625 RepID=A0A409XCP7_PSICY|nr:hypothetical protein CVT25_011989 [Psilocybe cyanescens]
MKSFVNILTFIALATFTSTTFVGVLATPVAAPGSVHYLQKRIAAPSSTWRSEEDPHSFMTARNVNMRRQLPPPVIDSGNRRPSTADIAQEVENITGTDKSQANVGPLSTDSSSVPSTAQQVTNAAQGVENSAGTTGSGDSTVSVTAPSDASDKVTTFDVPRADIAKLPASGLAT